MITKSDIEAAVSRNLPECIAAVFPEMELLKNASIYISPVYISDLFDNNDRYVDYLSIDFTEIPLLSHDSLIKLIKLNNILNLSIKELK